MSSTIIGRLLDKFYSRASGTRATILGLDYGGKTTLLYLLRLGTIVQTIPTIGFNVETVDIPTQNGKSFSMEGWDVGTGCGIGYLYGILSIYLEKSEALIWVVDASDKERLSESVESLGKILTSMKFDDYQDAVRKNFPILMWVYLGSLYVTYLKEILSHQTLEQVRPTREYGTRRCPDCIRKSHIRTPRFCFQNIHDNVEA